MQCDELALKTKKRELLYSYDNYADFFAAIFREAIISKDNVSINIYIGESFHKSTLIAEAQYENDNVTYWCSKMVRDYAEFQKHYSAIVSIQEFVKHTIGYKFIKSFTHHGCVCDIERHLRLKEYK